MRFLHTGDWHVGRTIRRRQRLEESAAVLAEIVEIAGAERVDVALICGDTFETFAPSAEAERIVYETLLKLSKAGVSVVLLAGNHDSSKRLEAVRALLEVVNVHVVSQPKGPFDGGVLDLRSRDGRQRAKLAALPWVPERRLFGGEELMGLEEEPHKAYGERIPRLLHELCKGFESDTVNILAAHLFVSGTRPGGGERELTIGQLFAITAAALPTTPQYVALGHVHRPQKIAGAPVPGCYAGSPLQLDFGEAGQRKSVRIIDADPGKPARVREVQLREGRALIDLHIPLAELPKYAGRDDGAYARVYLKCEGPAPGLVERVQEFLPGAVEVRLDYERTSPESVRADSETMSASDMFKAYYETKTGAAPDERLTQCFDELLEDVRDAAPAA